MVHFRGMQPGSSFFYFHPFELTTNYHLSYSGASTLPPSFSL
jgi:hypothetical protein